MITLATLRAIGTHLLHKAPQSKQSIIFHRIIATSQHDQSYEHARHIGSIAVARSVRTESRFSNLSQWSRDEISAMNVEKLLYIVTKCRRLRQETAVQVVHPFHQPLAFSSRSVTKFEPRNITISRNREDHASCVLTE